MTERKEQALFGKNGAGEQRVLRRKKTLCRANQKTGRDPREGKVTKKKKAKNNVASEIHIC